MRCLKCQQEMMEKLETITNNGKVGKDYKEYNKILYWCPKDDIWISIETPKQ